MQRYLHYYLPAVQGSCSTSTWPIYWDWNWTKKAVRGSTSKGINDINDDRCARNTDEIKQISVWISNGGCCPFTVFLLLAYRRWKERIPAKRHSNVAPNLRDKFHVYARMVRRFRLYFFLAPEKNTVSNKNYVRGRRGGSANWRRSRGC